MIRLFGLFFLICFLQLPASGQRQTDNWLFGQNASLEFNASGTPVSFQNSSMNTPQGSASISDKAGNLLFYTNGETVWNRLHQVMTNGTGLFGNPLTAQPTIIVPKPGSDSTFYVFTVFPNNHGLRYSTVVFSNNAPNGEVTQATKNAFLYGSSSAPISGKITAVHHANNQEIWVIIHRSILNTHQEFQAYRVTANGVQTTAVTSSVTTPNISGNTEGQLKASPSGNRLGAGFGTSGLFLFEFDNATGVVSSPLLLRAFGNAAYYGLEFSADGSKFYGTSGNQIEQYNLAAGAWPAIVSSRTVFNVVGAFGAMQLASNGKIYVVQPNNGRVWIINFPNLVGTASNLVNGFILATGTQNRFGLPNFIQSYFAPPRFNYAGICAELPTIFTIPNLTNIDSVKWKFNDPQAGTSDTSSQFQPTYTFGLPGIFTVRLTVFQQGFRSVFERQVTILNKPKVQLPKDTSLCEGMVITVSNSFPPNPFNERWLWSTGNTDSTVLRIDSPGIYWLELTNGVCTTRDSIVVAYRPVPKVNLGPDLLLCGNVPVLLDAGNPGATYLWQPGLETTQTLAISKPGVYSVTVTSNRCSATDAVKINYNTIPGFEFGADITVCEGEPVILKTLAPAPSVTYAWSDSSTGPVLKVKRSGKYWATVNQNGCVFTDTVTVTFKNCPPPIVPYIPNIISPNNDNRNDKFEIRKIPPGSWALRIYNRWGQQIFNTTGYANNWPEKEVSNGTYYYYLEEPETGRNWKGWVEVVR